MYCSAGRALSWLWQAIHFAPGATPIWLPAPSSPIAVPIVCVPCESAVSSSHGAGVLKPHGFVPLPSMSAWTASHQL